METIDLGEIPFGHFWETIEDMSHYPISRIIMILAAFERTFRIIYGQDVRRSDDYKAIKSEVAQLIEEHAENMTGKQKKYVKGFVKGILNSDSSYNIRLSDCIDFVMQLWNCKSVNVSGCIRQYKWKIQVTNLSL